MLVETISGKPTTKAIRRSAIRRFDMAGTAGVCGLFGGIVAATAHGSPLPFRVAFAIMIMMIAGVWYYVRRNPPRGYIKLLKKNARGSSLQIPSFALVLLCAPLSAAMGYVTFLFVT
jgi:hypothetical protein